MMNTKRHKVLVVVLVLAVIVVLLTVVGAVNHVLALKEANKIIAQDVEISGSSVFLRSVIVLVAEGLSAGVALFFILRGSVLAAHNSSAVFLSVMVMVLLLKGMRLIEGPIWQVFVSAVWLSLLAWLLWRIVPNTSLNQDAAKRRAV